MEGNKKTKVYVRTSKGNLKKVRKVKNQSTTIGKEIDKEYKSPPRPQMGSSWSKNRPYG